MDVVVLVVVKVAVLLYTIFLPTKLYYFIIWSKLFQSLFFGKFSCAGTQKSCIVKPRSADVRTTHSLYLFQKLSKISRNSQGLAEVWLNISRELSLLNTAYTPTCNTLTQVWSSAMIVTPQTIFTFIQFSSLVQVGSQCFKLNQTSFWYSG